MRAKKLVLLQALTMLLVGTPGFAQSPDATQKEQAAQEAKAQAEQEAQAQKEEAKARQEEAKAEKQAKEVEAKARAEEAQADQKAKAADKAKAKVEVKLTQESKALEDAKRAIEESVRTRIIPSGDYYGLSTFMPLLDQDPRYAVLMRPVDVTLDRATVRQLGEALSKASNLTITVDKVVPEDIRLTVDARGVALATVLEAVARQAKLIIAPPPKETRA